MRSHFFIFILMFTFAPAAFSAGPQILIPHVSGDTSAYTGDNWFAVPITKKGSNGEVLKGAVTFGPPEIEGLGDLAKFTPAEAKNFNDEFFEKYFYVRNVAGLKEGPIEVLRPECLYKSEAKKPVTCTLQTKTQKISFAEEYLGWNDRTGSPNRQFTISINGGAKTIIKAQELDIVSDINHDSKIDFVFLQGDTTELYTTSEDSKELKLLATATGEGC